MIYLMKNKLFLGAGGISLFPRIKANISLVNMSHSLCLVYLELVGCQKCLTRKCTLLCSCSRLLNVSIIPTFLRQSLEILGRRGVGSVLSVFVFQVLLKTSLFLFPTSLFRASVLLPQGSLRPQATKQLYRYFSYRFITSA